MDIFDNYVKAGKIASQVREYARAQDHTGRSLSEICNDIEQEIFKNGAEHATKDHGMKPEDITPQFKEKLRGLIRNS